MQRKYLWLVAIAVSIIALDQWTKLVVLQKLTGAFDGAADKGTLSVMYGEAPSPGFSGYHYRPTAPVVMSDDFLQLRYAENQGAAFGLFRNLPENARGPLFHLVSIGAVILIGYYFSKLTGAANERWAKLGLPLVLGGAIGNYIDRLARGFVIDFVEAHWHEKAYWPAFNVADMAIVVGVGALVIDSFVRKDSKEPAKALA